MTVRNAGSSSAVFSSRRWVALALASLTAGALGVAPASAGATMSQARVVGAAHDECPALFGAAALRRANTRHRQRYLHWMIEERTGTTIAHSHPRWREPFALQIPGLSLMDGDDERPLVEVESALARQVGCPAGLYVVEEDDAIGRRARILSARPDLLLVEHGGRLGFLLPEGVEAPEFLMAWRIPQAEYRPTSAKGGARASAAARQAAARAAKARKARAKRSAKRRARRKR